MRVLVTGANGQLGNELRIVSGTCIDEYIFTDVVLVEGVETQLLDITDLEAVRSFVVERGVDVIVNCAAYTNVDAAENDEVFAELLNAKAPGNLATVMKEVGGLLVHISTDYVFGGEKSDVPFSEDVPSSPLGAYGRTKLHGEQNVVYAGCDHVIIRTSWLYSEFGRNFCKTMIDLTSTRSQIKVVSDQTGTPTYALDLAKAVTVILSDYASHYENRSSHIHPEERSDVRISYPHSGIYHYSNEGICSWFDFAVKIAEYNGSADCEIQPCTSSEYPSPVRRPAYSVLDKTKIKETFGVSVPEWTDSLKQCISNLKSSSK